MDGPVVPQPADKTTTVTITVTNKAILFMINLSHYCQKTRHVFGIESRFSHVTIVEENIAALNIL